MNAIYGVVPGRLAAVALLSLLSLLFRCSAVSLKAADAGHGAGGPALIAGDAFKRHPALLHAATEPAKTVKHHELWAGRQTSAVGSRERFAGLQRGVAKQAPQRFLTPKELAPITTIRCLQDKQRNPHRPCEQDPDEGRFELGTLGIGHYPHYKNRICHSNQEFFCDPTKLLTIGAQEKSTEELRLFRERTLVNCGQLESILDPDAERRPYEKRNPVFQGRLGLEDYREFNLAVVLADEWPKSIRDTASMQTFGWRVMSDWGLQPIYNGVDNGNPVNEYRNTWNGYRANCPTTAVLIILPRYHQAFLTSPSCEFICQTRGGPEVVAATLAALESGGLESAIHAGIQQAHKVLDATIPKSITKDGELMPWRGHLSGRVGGAAQSESATVGTLRFLYALLIFAIVFFGVAFCYFMAQPDSLKNRERRHMLASDVDQTWVRKTIREELVST